MPKLKRQPNPILEFHAFVRAPSEGEETDLRMQFFRPQPSPTARMFVGEALIACRHFEDTVRIAGACEMQALLLLLGQVHRRLIDFESEGYAIYIDTANERPIDTRFWGVQARSIYAYRSGRRVKRGVR